MNEPTQTPAASAPSFEHWPDIISLISELEPTCSYDNGSLDFISKNINMFAQQYNDNFDKMMTETRNSTWAPDITLEKWSEYRSELGSTITKGLLKIFKRLYPRDAESEDIPVLSPLGYVRARQFPHYSQISSALMINKVKTDGSTENVAWVIEAQRVPELDVRRLSLEQPSETSAPPLSSDTEMLDVQTVEAGTTHDATLSQSQ